MKISSIQFLPDTLKFYKLKMEKCQQIKTKSWKGWGAGNIFVVYTNMDKLKKTIGGKLTNILKTRSLGALRARPDF